MVRSRRGPPARVWSGLIVGIGILAVVISAPGASDAAVPAGFLENIGQDDDTVLFRASAAGAEVYFTQSGVLVDVAGAMPAELAEPDRSAAAGRFAERRTGMTRERCAVLVRFAAANPAPQVEGGRALPGLHHFLRGSDPSAWHTGARVFEEVTYRDVWPGVDLVFRPVPGGLAYDVVAHPGADLSRIEFGYEGAERVAAAAATHRIETPVGALIHRLPTAEVANGAITREGAEVLGSFGGRTVAVGWCTFLGSAGLDGAWASAVDHQGNPVVCGATDAIDFPEVTGHYQENLAGDLDAFVAKLDPAGTSVLWATYLGGTLFDRALDLDVDADGNVLTLGETQSADFPVTAGAFDTTPSNTLTDSDGFVSKLSGDGTALIWSTYLGGRYDEIPWNFEFDAQWNVVLTGDTQSGNFPTTVGAYQETHANAGMFDAFVTKLAAAGDALIWSTFLGGPEHDEAAWQIRLDGQENPMVVGMARSPGFPTTAGAYQETYQGGDYDGFVTKLLHDGSDLVWSTFLGGVDQDITTGVAINAAGNLVIGARTKSWDFPSTPETYDPSYNGSVDLAFVEMNPTASAVHWGTFLGGSMGDWSANLELGPGDYLVTAGSTYSSDFPVTPDALGPTYGAVSDGIIAMMSPDGTALLYGSFCGGTGTPWTGFMEGFVISHPVTIMASGDLLLAGVSWSADCPTTPGAFDRIFDGAADAIVLRMMGPVGVPDLAEASSGLRLSCSPNPFRGTTAIRFHLPAAGPVEVALYDAGGRFVRMLESSELAPAGLRQLVWNGANEAGAPAAAGVYFCRVTAGSLQDSQRIVFLR